MKSKGLMTNALKANVQAGPEAKAVPVQTMLKSKGKAAPTATVKAKQKPMSKTTKRLGNHF